MAVASSRSRDLTRASGRYMRRPSARKTELRDRSITPADTLTWKSIQEATLSPDGQWFSYRVSASEGDGELILRRTKGTEEKHIASGLDQERKAGRRSLT